MYFSTRTNSCNVKAVHCDPTAEVNSSASGGGKYVCVETGEMVNFGSRTQEGVWLQELRAQVKLMYTSYTRGDAE